MRQVLAAHLGDSGSTLSSGGPRKALGSFNVDVDIGIDIDVDIELDDRLSNRTCMAYYGFYGGL